MRKGQAAMEFLMTYGYAILIVLACIGALAYYGVLDPDNFNTEIGHTSYCKEQGFITSECKYGFCWCVEQNNIINETEYEQWKEETKKK